MVGGLLFLNTDCYNLQQAASFVLHKDSQLLFDKAGPEGGQRVGRLSLFS